ncbi:MAG: 2'-5' RNA ligase family protein [Candidatus Sphingomonas colombiensis]|nr:2'-5' RNA ligase family protein [Sphingomonas sp.]WEK43431.1 MAG: 2'-5' RNA ligase family protein [Sphingomonas sp.]
MNAPIVVTALFGAADQAWFDSLRRAYYPPEQNRIAAHLTLFHHLPPSQATEVKHRLSLETHNVARPLATLREPYSLGSGVAWRIESVALAEIRARLGEAFAGLLVPQDMAGWRPHVTIQNKVAPHTARTLLAAMGAGFRPRPVTITGLAAWWYRGGPWEPLSRHMFG